MVGMREEEGMTYDLSSLAAWMTTGIGIEREAAAEVVHGEARR